MHQMHGICSCLRCGMQVWGSLQMDLAYATIPTFDNTFVNVNREQEKRYHVEDPMNELLYEIEDHGNYAILSNSLAPIKENFKEERVSDIWKMNLDEAHSKTGTGADVLVVSASMFHPSDELMNGQDKMEFTFKPSIPNNVEQIFDICIKRKKR